MQDIDAFAAIASTYEGWFTTPLGRFVDQQELQALARLLSGIDPGAVIDIGAGTGHMAAWLARRSHQVTAVEPSSAMRHEGVRRTAGLPIHWCAACAEHLPFADARFTGAVLFTTLAFVTQPVQALQEAVRVVRPAGWVTVGVLHALSPWVALYRSRADHGAMPWVAARFFTPEDVEGFIGAAATSSTEAVYLAPQASAPFAEADGAGKRAGNQPALAILQWRKSA